ncbi:MAG: hypothetical protein ACYS7Y_30005 [Planctomycetota bacterium]|jgi:hypothetical protein
MPLAKQKPEERRDITRLPHDILIYTNPEGRRVASISDEMSTGQGNTDFEALQSLCMVLNLSLQLQRDITRRLQDEADGHIRADPLVLEPDPTVMESFKAEPDLPAESADSLPPEAYDPPGDTFIEVEEDGIPVETEYYGGMPVVKKTHDELAQEYTRPERQLTEGGKLTMEDLPTDFFGEGTAKVEDICPDDDDCPAHSENV